MRLRPSPLAFITHIAAVCAAATCLAQTARPRYPLSVAGVADAFVAAGVQVTPADVTLPSALTATVPSPQFTLGTAELSGPAQLRVRVSCAQSGQCLPFMVVTDLHTHVAAVAAQEHLTPFSTLSPQSAVKDVLRAGQRATLLMEDGHMRISLPVISIDTGSPGTQIRVASLDRKQIYRGVVTNAGTVRGALP